MLDAQGLIERKPRSGVLRADRTATGVELPEDIQLITYANKGLPFHKPVTRMKFDVEAQAERAVDLKRNRAETKVKLLTEPQNNKGVRL